MHLALFRHRIKHHFKRKLEIPCFPLFLFVSFTVKTGTSRAKKFAEKHDPQAIMLRIKKAQETMKQKFQTPAMQDYYIDINVLEWITALGLPFGKAGTLMDLTKQYVWKIADMSAFEIEAMHLKFISKDFTEDQYDQWLSHLYAKQYEITTLYNYCHRLPSRLWVNVEWKEPHNTVPKLDVQVEYGV